MLLNSFLLFFFIHHDKIDCYKNILMAYLTLQASLISMASLAFTLAFTLASYHDLKKIFCPSLYPRYLRKLI